MIRALWFIAACLMLCACGEVPEPPLEPQSERISEARLRSALEESLRRIQLSQNGRAAVPAGKPDFCPAVVLWGDNGKKSTADWIISADRNPSAQVNGPTLLFSVLAEASDFFSASPGFFEVNTNTNRPFGPKDRIDGIILSTSSSASHPKTITLEVTALSDGQQEHALPLEISMKTGNYGYKELLGGSQAIGYLVSPYPEHCRDSAP